MKIYTRFKVKLAKLFIQLIVLIIGFDVLFNVERYIAEAYRKELTNKLKRFNENE